MSIDLSSARYAGERVHLAISVAGAADVTLTMDQVKAGILEFTGALTGDINVNFPNIDGQNWGIYNNTSGAHTLTVRVTGATGFAVTQAKTRAVWCNGTDLLPMGAESP